MLVFYCFVNNYPKLSSLKQYLFLRSGLVWLDSLLRVSQAETKGQQGSTPFGGSREAASVFVQGVSSFRFCRASLSSLRLVCFSPCPNQRWPSSPPASLRLPPVLRFT
ncbi:unnamed protein product [Pipistrellus nathusii]|uniref:Uncharacterized protein n=1 Tax=Pipistrellus nathusii TaxID=59473 RepID=A0ABN9ZBS3_PIPNA